LHWLGFFFLLAIQQRLVVAPVERQDCVALDQSQDVVSDVDAEHLGVG